VQQAEESALTHVYKLLEKEPTQTCFIAIDEKSGRKDSFKELFAKFPNQQIELIPSPIPPVNRRYDGSHRSR
jgi:hypothetical protein